MAATTFDTAYGQNPWVGIDRNTIPYYVPALSETFRRSNVYAAFSTFAVSLLAENTTSMTFSEIYDLEYNKDAIDNHALWLDTQYFDSRLHTIETASYGGKVALHKHDPRVTYWRLNGGDIKQIAQGALGLSMTQQIDEMTRDAYLQGPYWLISGHTSDIKTASGYPNFGTIEATDTFDPDIAQSIWLVMDHKMVPGAADPTGLGGRNLVCITTGGVWHDMITDSSLDLRNKINTVRDRRLLFNYEVGEYMNIRYIKTPINVLWNAGAITKQTTLTADVPVGAGAAVSNTVYTVGQSALRTSTTNSDPGQRYISVSDATGFAVGDMLTIHKTRTNRFGVTGGVDFLEGTLTNRQIVSINGNNIALDKPVLKTEYVQGDYVTKALHIHANVFVGGPRGVVWAVTQSPLMYNPPVVDDRMAQWRATWDMTAKPQPFKPEWYYVVYSAGASAEGLLSNV
ncbi:MAG: hypothetical protein GWN58_27645 [Anaerolineae bacterium]|nr:hypothetical protein [Anaerolineae bacterium]